MPNRSQKNKKLYNRMRDVGLRKRVARQLTELTSHVNGRKKAPKPMREAVDRLEATVSELRSHVRRSDRKAAGGEAARTRGAKSGKHKAARSRS
jgi:archaellum component FlaC